MQNSSSAHAGEVVRALVVVGAICFAAPVFATEGYFSHGWGTNSKAVAGADIAFSTGLMSAAQNPALLSYTPREIDFNIAWFNPNRMFEATADNTTFWPQGAKIHSGRPDFLIPTVGASIPINHKTNFALLVYGNGGMNTSYPASANGGAGVFGSGKTGVNLEQLFVSPTVAYNVNDKMSVGLAGIYAYQKFSATGLQAFGGMVADGNPDNLTNNGDDTSSGFGFKVGVEGKVCEKLSYGASYQPRMKMSAFKKYSDLFAEQGHFDIPETISGGVAYRPDEKSTWMFEVRRINYAGVKAVGNPMSNLFDGMMNSDPTKLLGGSDGVGFGWRDMTIYKLGYLYDAGDGAKWSLGISYGKQPVPSTETLFNILAPGVQEWQLTWGFSRQVNPNQEFHMSLMYSPNKAVTGQNPLSPGQTISISMLQLELELGCSWKF